MVNSPWQLWTIGMNQLILQLSKVKKDYEIILCTLALLFFYSMPLSIIYIIKREVYRVFCLSASALPLFMDWFWKQEYLWIPYDPGMIEKYEITKFQKIKKNNFWKTSLPICLFPKRMPQTRARGRRRRPWSEWSMINLLFCNLLS